MKLVPLKSHNVTLCLSFQNEKILNALLYARYKDKPAQKQHVALDTLS